MTEVSAPLVGSDDSFFWRGLSRRELLIQRCASCGRLRHPPRPMCPSCNSLEWETQPSTRRGVVLSYIVPRHPPVDSGDERIAVLIELEEGVRMVSNLRGVRPENVANGMEVEVFCDEVADGVTLPQARPRAAERG